MSSHSVRSSLLLVALLASAVSLPSTLRAQRSAAAGRTSSGMQASTVETVVAPVGIADAATVAGPRATPAGISRPVQANPLGLAEPQGGGQHIGAGSNLALMGVGGAAVVIGLLIGGDGGTILALGGAVIGLVGLYRYLQ